MTHRDRDPLSELSKVQQRMNRLFESALARTDFDAEGGIGSWTPLADVFETDSELVHCLELPGVRQDDIDLRVDGNELVVEGERRMSHSAERGEQFHRVERSYGKFVRRFPLPPTVDRASVRASFRHGVLRVSLVKTDEPSGPIRVSIR